MRLLSAREHLTLVADLYELQPQAARSKAEQLLELLPPAIPPRPAETSHG